MKLRIIIIYLLLIALIATTSCNKGNKNWLSRVFGGKHDNTSLILTPEAYSSWMNDEKDQLQRKKEIEDIVFEIRYKPIEYIILNETGKQELADSVYQKMKSELDGMYYFDFRISLKEGSGELIKYKIASSDEYQHRVTYFAFDMQKDITLHTKNKIIPCGLFHFERAYDVTPYSIFLLGFSRKDMNESDDEEVTFEYHDNVFKKGIIKFTYTIGDLKNLPKLKTI